MLEEEEQELQLVPVYRSSRQYMCVRAEADTSLHLVDRELLMADCILEEEH